MYDMHYSFGVRKLFSARARLVVYVESTDADGMEKLARSEGKTLVEWMRETLLGELEANSALRTEREVPVARRGASVAGPRDAGGRLGEGSATVYSGGAGTGLAASAEERESANNGSRKTKVCAHGTAKGHNCWQCGGVAVME